MSDAKKNNAGAGFGNFDFLQNLLQVSSPLSGPMSGPANWMTPSLNVEEIDKRINELKAVHFWLEQNSKALAATVQALEVQKMTLATLKTMNFDVGQIAKAFQPKAATTATKKATEKAPAAPTAMIDPMQMWAALTEQFGKIAASAMPDAGHSGHPAAARTAHTKAAPGQPAAGERKTGKRSRRP